MFQQKNKKTNFILKSFCGAKTFLSIFFLGSSVFASGFSLPSEPVVQPPKKDLSVFVSKLSERLQGVFGELLQLGSSVVTQQQLGSGSLLSALSSSSVSVHTGGLQDIAGTLYQSDIQKLANRGVIDSQRLKFYPENFLRKYEMVMMLVKYSLDKQNQQFPQIVFSTRGWFADVAQNVSYAPYVAYANQQGWLEKMIVMKNDKKYFNPNDFLKKQEICDLFVADCSDLVSTGSKITRGEFVHLLIDQEGVVQSDQSTSSSNASLLSTLKTIFAFAQ